VGCQAELHYLILSFLLSVYNYMYKKKTDLPVMQLVFAGWPVSALPFYVNLHVGMCIILYQSSKLV